MATVECKMPLMYAESKRELHYNEKSKLHMDVMKQVFKKYKKENFVFGAQVEVLPGDVIATRSHRYVRYTGTKDFMKIVYDMTTMAEEAKSKKEIETINCQQNEEKKTA